MQHSSILLASGIFFCCTALYLFYKNAFEEGRSIKSSLLIMMMGVILLGLGMAAYYEAR